MGSNQIKNIYAADFETVTMNTNYYKEYNDTTVLLAYVEHLETSENFLCANLSEFMNFFFKKNHSSIVYLHNLSFDGYYILCWLSKEKWIPVQDISKVRKNCYEFFASGTSIYSIRVKYCNGNDYYILEFRCSYKLLVAPINSLGKDLNIEKWKENQNNSKFYVVEPKEKVTDYDEDFVEYCKRDVEILKKSLNSFFKIMEDIKKMDIFSKSSYKNKLTISAISYSLQKSVIYKKYGIYIYRGLKQSTMDNEIANKFYSGGLTQFNISVKDQLTKCNGLCIDINSAYPYVMSKFNIPYGNISSRKPIGDYVEWLEIYVKSASSKEQGFPVLKNWNLEKSKIKSRYVERLDDFTCYYLKEEWEILQNFYDFSGVKIINTFYQKSAPYLKEFINELYHYKVKYKKENKNSFSHIFKIILNSSYGIHAKRSIYNEVYLCKNKEEYDSYKENDIIEVNKNKKLIVKNKQMNKTFDLYNYYGLVCTPVYKTKKKCNNKFIAAFITAMERVYLLQQYLLLKDYYVAYVDTDSFYLLEKPKKLEEVVRVDEFELGAWKKEFEFDEIQVRGAKAYYTMSKGKVKSVKHSGVQQRFLKDTLPYKIFDITEVMKENNGVPILKNATIRKKYCKSGLLLYESDYRINERNQ